MIFELELPSNLGSIHFVFYVSMVKRCVGDFPLVVPLESVGFLGCLFYVDVPVEILDRQIPHLRTKDMALAKVQRRNHKVKEAYGKLK